MCEGRVCIVTGAGRGLGREYARSLARHGAKVVVNDLGGSRDGTGTDTGPAQEVVDEITATGGEAAANTDDISSWDGAASLVQQAIDTFGGLDVLVNNAGILRDRMLFSMTEEEWDGVIRVHLKGTFAPSHHAAAYWRERSKSGETGRRTAGEHHLGVRPVRQRRPDQLRRRQGRYRRRSRRSPHRSCRATASP